MPAGATWPAAYGSDVNPLNIRKALFGSILVRDYNGAATSLTGITPFETDGNLKSSLLISQGGSWYDPGALTDAGPEFTPNLTVSPTPIWQSRRTARTDIDKDDDMVMIVCREQNPVVECLDLNLPLSQMLDLGQIGYGVSKPNQSDTIERQMIAIGVDGSTGRNQFFARVYPRIVINKTAKKSWNPKNAIDTELHFDVLSDPWTVGPDLAPGPPYIIYREGPAWRAQGGAPNFGMVAPTATAGTTGKASIVFAKPTGQDVGTVTYTGEKSTDAGVTWTAGAPDGATWAAATTITGGNVTLKFATLTAGATKLRAIATGDNGVSTTSAASNSVTVT